MVAEWNSNIAYYTARFICYIFFVCVTFCDIHGIKKFQFSQILGSMWEGHFMVT